MAMLIIAGTLRVSPATRDEYVANCATVVETARRADGCSAFAITADSVDAGVILVYERWETEAQLMAFRGSGPSDDQQAAILEADVKRYTISAIGEP